VNQRKEVSRRSVILTSAAAAGGAWLAALAARAVGQDSAMRPAAGVPAAPPSRAGATDAGAGTLVTPDGASLPWRMVDGAKVFHLVAEPVEHEFLPGLTAQCWGYNGRVHGPTLEAVEGDRVRIYVTNKLPAATTVHWHGVLVPNGMDGVGGLTQRAIHPGETFRYEFTLRQHGTFMYHSHHDEMTQMALGLMGLIVVHPQKPAGPVVDRDYAMMLSEWKIVPGTRRPDPNEMTDFNILTMNARAFPGTQPLVARRGERVRIRLGNLSAMDHHPIHLHGHNFHVTATDGGDVPESAQRPETTVLVPVGSTRTIEFTADVPGDWALHCHMTHHVMNQMGHGIPNLIGVKAGALDEKVRRLLPDYMTMGQHGMGGMGHMHMAVPPNSVPMVGGSGPFDEITMGGMFTILKVRESLTGDEDPGWYEHPAGSVAEAASADELKRDAIDAEPAPPPDASVIYTCPMHPSVTSKQPGSCPICGMTLVRRP
jgi:FtsP/CotA-like multicopper oxidase with cupredoxin domain